jgi:hypothetical protein
LCLFPFFFCSQPHFPIFFFLPFLFSICLVLPIFFLVFIALFPSSSSFFPLPLSLLSFHAFPPCLFGQLKFFNRRQIVGVYWTVTKKVWLSSNILTLTDYDQKILVAIQHTHTIRWWLKFFSHPWGKWGMIFFPKW